MRLLSSWCGFPCAFPRVLSAPRGCPCTSGQHLEDAVQQIVDTAAMLRRNRKHIPHPEHMKLVEQSLLLVRVHLVDREKERLAGAREQPSQFAIGPRDLRPSIDDHDNCRRFFERNLSLAEDLRWYEIFVVGNNAARIHNSKLVPEPFDLAIEAVASDARLI